MTTTLNQDEFVERYGGVYEHSPWIARASYQAGRSAADAQTLAAVMQQTVNAADDTAKLELIRAHPDLAGRLALAGGLTAESSSEQASAGLDQCSAAEYELFQRHNQAYVEKFEFPFVMAVKGSNRTEILAAFARRLNNDYADEFATAIEEIHKIARMRLEQLF